MKCDDCHGTGLRSGLIMPIMCEVCAGTGYVAPYYPEHTEPVTVTRGADAVAQADAEGSHGGVLTAVRKSPRGTHMPVDYAVRKAIPLCTGVLDYFPDALAAVAKVSRIGNDQHNPGQPLHWAKEKSTDHADCALRHFADRGQRDTDGGRHTAKAAWRVLAYLQMEIEAERAGMSFNDYIAWLKAEAASPTKETA
jgi:hypothetical protein